MSLPQWLHQLQLITELSECTNVRHWTAKAYANRVPYGFKAPSEASWLPNQPLAVRFLLHNLSFRTIQPTELLMQVFTIILLLTRNSQQLAIILQC